MGSTTTNLNLYKPTQGEVGWDAAVNTNFDTADAQIFARAKKLSTATEVNGAGTDVVNTIVVCSPTTASFTRTLPIGAVIGDSVVYRRKAVGGTNTVSVAPGGSETINTATSSITLEGDAEAKVFVSGGNGDWTLISGHYSKAWLNATYASETGALHKATTETVTGDKNFTGALTKSGISVATSADVTNAVNGKAVDNTVVHLAGSETVTGAKNFTGGLTVNGASVASSTDINTETTRATTAENTKQKLIPQGTTFPSSGNVDGDLFVRTDIDASGIILGTTSGTAAAGNDSRIVNAVPKSAIPLNAADYGALGTWNGTTGADDTSALQAWLADCESKSRDGYLPPGRYRLTGTAGLSWRAIKHNIYSTGNAMIDASNMTSGYALSIVGGTGDQFGFTHSSVLHEMVGIRLIGPDTDSTTVDAIYVSSVSGQLTDHVNLRNCFIYGFRDQLSMGDNAFLLKGWSLEMGHAHRRILSFGAQTNGGENNQFHGCGFYSSHNATNDATAVYTDANAQYLGVNFFGCSFDYNDIEIDCNAGVLNLDGCHYEDNVSGPMIKQSYTAGKHLSVININGGVFNPAEATGSARSHLIETKSTSGGGVHLNLNGPMFRLYDRFTKVYKNLSSASPRVTHNGPMLDLGYSTNVGSMGEYTNLITDGGFENSAAGFGSTIGYAGIWYRQGTVAYSFDTSVFHSGTKSLKMVGDGTTATSGLSQGLPVIAQKLCQLSFYYNIQNWTAGSIQVRFVLYRQDGTTAFISPNTLTTFSASTSGWTPYSSQFMVPAGSAWAVLQFVNVNLNATWYVDDVVVTQV